MICEPLCTPFKPMLAQVETLGVREQVIAAAQASSPCEGGPALMTQADLASAGGTTPGGNPGLSCKRLPLHSSHAAL